MGRTVYEAIDYWVDQAQADLKFSASPDDTKRMATALADSGLGGFQEFDDKGIIFYMICQDLRGKRGLLEQLMYIKPEYRGGRLFCQMVKAFEKIARDNECDYVTLAANIGYRDDKVLKLLQTMGYSPETMRMEIT